MSEPLHHFITHFIKHPAMLELADIVEFNLDLSPLNSYHLACAFCHRSFINETQVSLKSYERYEFLGDAVLQLMVTEILYEKYPELNEGALSKLRSSLVSCEGLNELTGLLPIQELVLLGVGERERQGHLNPSLKSQVFEALLGSLYIIQDKNFEILKKQFLNIVKYYNQKKQQDFFDKNKLESIDAKSRFQELLMKAGLGHPLYDAKEIDSNCFEVSLLVNKKIIKKDVGTSKKKIEKELATWGLNNLNDVMIMAK